MQLTKEAKGFSNFSWRVLLYVRRTSILQQEQSVTGWAALIDTSHHSRWMYTWQALSFICIYQQKSARKPSKLTDESKGQNHEQSTPSSSIETRQKNRPTTASNATDSRDRADFRPFLSVLNQTLWIKSKRSDRLIHSLFDFQQVRVWAALVVGG